MLFGFYCQPIDDIFAVIFRHKPPLVLSQFILVDCCVMQFPLLLILSSIRPCLAYTSLNCKIDPPILLPSLLLYIITLSKVSRWLVVFKTPNRSWKWSTITSILCKFRCEERQFFDPALLTFIPASPCNGEHFRRTNLFYLHFERPVHASAMV
jgi:hypothetical protein